MAPVTPTTASKPPAADAEPNLEGLSEVPPELIWKRAQEDGKKAKTRSFATLSAASEQLPWDDVEPVHFTPLKPGEKTTPGPANNPAKETAGAGRPEVADLPGGGELSQWVKSKVTHIKGAARSRPLFHFELWLEPPANVRQRLVGVAYNFSTPAVMPQSQASSDKTSGFRISAGGLACADEIALTLRFDDGQSKTISVDGCELKTS